MPVEKEVWIVYVLVYTLFTQLHTPQPSLIPAGKAVHHLCSANIVIQKQHPKSVSFHFMGHWIKELCNVQYFNIFYLSSSLLFFVIHSMSRETL